MISFLSRRPKWLASNIRSHERLFFLHIPKTAGTSFVDTVINVYSKKFSANYIEGLPLNSRLYLSNKNFISGHLSYDEVFRLPYIGDYKTCVVLREPYARLVSHIRYMDRYNLPSYEGQCKMLKPDLQDVVRQLKGVDFSSALSLEKFFKNMNAWAISAFDNCQTRFLTCDPLSPALSPSLPLPDYAHRLAQDRLSRFDVIGITERFDDTMSQVSTAIRHALPSYRAFSNTDSSPRKIDINNNEMRHILAPFVEKDIHVYNAGLKLFNDSMGAVKR
ncbi:sulfotransferase family 2 domain-containing protein [Labrys neptuniae]